MIRVELAREDDVEGALTSMSRLVRDRHPPEAVEWVIGRGEPDLFGEAGAFMPAGPVPPLPSAFRALAETALLHADPGRFRLLHRLLAKVMREPGLLANPAEPDRHAAEALAKAVRRDKHKMKAFVRFREQDDGSGRPVFVAWFEPTHHIVRAIAPFFVARFATMRWSILTPETSAHWDGQTLRFAAGATRADGPTEDPMEEIWRIYYRATFNPARLKVKAMCAEMPKKYWHNLPEATLIAPLIREAEARAEAMIGAEATKPARRIPDSALYAGKSGKRGLR